ncbi:MAG: AAA family ATPase [Deltaproteobacteria bacterium]|nr:AAA family ATPase [Deltaproteobacteria bacterium]
MKAGFDEGNCHLPRRSIWTALALELKLDIAPKIPYIFGAMFKREIIPSKSKSYFLFGPRQTGKSTFVKSLITDKDLYLDLLPQRNFLNYAKKPGRLREEILAHLRRYDNPLCIIDEIQKIPDLLDEVHELIETGGIWFILTGSSARKLRRGGANLLAGRAYTYRLFPLTYRKSIRSGQSPSFGHAPRVMGIPRRRPRRISKGVHGNLS